MGHRHTTRLSTCLLVCVLSACNGKDEPTPKPADLSMVATSPGLITVDEDGSVRVRLDGFDPDGSDPLSVEVTDGPKDGKLDATVGAAPLQVTYRPDRDVHGLDSFSFVVTDGSLRSAPEDVVIDVLPVNDAPAAKNDRGSTDTVTALVLDVLANDRDVEGDALSVASFTQPSTGLVALNLDGTLTVTPAHPSVAPIDFTYTVQDAAGARDTAAVTVTVTTGTPVSIDAFTASPLVLELGASTALTWQSTGATTCDISGLGIAGATSGSVNASPSTDTRYTLTCQGPQGPAIAELLVIVSPDTDGDGLLDHTEFLLGYDALDADMDDDGLVDGLEDRNGDGVLDADETDPRDADSDDDGLLDGIEDVNGNGQWDTGEFDPRDADSDDDGLLDGDEDLNGNGLVDGSETSPLLPDTDADGRCDGPRLDNDGDGIDPASSCTGREGVWMVDDDAVVGGDGHTWATAFDTIQAALAVAEPFDQIWVAAGTYTPSVVGASTVVMRDDVDLYGGFLGTEAELAERPPPDQNSSNLSGDFTGNGVPDSGPVVVGANAVLDGFRVWRGTAADGGGMRNDAVSPTVRSCAFLSTEADNQGGAIANLNMDGHVFTAENVTISSTLATMGGAIFQRDGTFVGESISIVLAQATRGGGIRGENADIEIRGLTLVNSLADDGGGMSLNGGTLTLVEHPDALNIIVGNQAIGTTIGIGGALHLSNASATLASTYIAENKARRGGGIYAFDGSVDVRDSGLVRNEAESGGGGVWATSVAFTGTHTHFEGNFVTDVDAVGAGGLWLEYSTSSLDLYGVDFIDNQGSGTGGGLCFLDGGDVVIENAVFRDNRLTPSRTGEAVGAGAYIDGNVSLSNVAFDGNRVLGAPPISSGGGVHITSASPVDIVNSSFHDNHAELGGAISGSFAGGLDVRDSVFWGNQAMAGDVHAFSGTLTGSGNCGLDDNLDPVALPTSPFLLGAGGHLFLQGACVDTGTSAWPGATQPDGTLDTFPGDPGYHFDPDRPWIETFEDVGGTLTWRTHHMSQCSVTDGSLSLVSSDTSGVAATNGDVYHLHCDDGRREFSATTSAQRADFDTAGETTFVVPPGVWELEVEVWGAGGGGGSGTAGAAGGFAWSRLDVTPGDLLTVVVGGPGLAQMGASVPGGYGGGGASGGNEGGHLGGSGGGLSGIFDGDATVTFDTAGQARALVVAGGGAGGSSYNNQVGDNHGAGGGASGGLGSVDAGDAGYSAFAADRVGHPGTSTAGGASCTAVTYCDGLPDGAALLGAPGGQYGGSGGGGGYWGGGGGAAYFNGSGGSGYVDPATPYAWLVTGDEWLAPQYWDTDAGTGGDRGGALSAPGTDGVPGRVLIRY